MLLSIGTPALHTTAEPLAMMSDCHRRIERALQVLVGFAAVHEPLNAERREQLAKTLRFFRETAPKHTADEEESLFPRLLSAGASDVWDRVNALEDDHARADGLHGTVDALGAAWLRDGQLNEEQSQQFARAIQELQTIYTAHIALEDGEVFPLAERLLSPEAKQQIGREMAARRGGTAWQPQQS